MRVETHIKNVEILTIPLYTDPKYKFITKLIGGDFDSSCRKDVSSFKAHITHYRLCTEVILYNIKCKFNKMIGKSNDSSRFRKNG